MPKKTCLNCYWFAPSVNQTPTYFGVCAKLVIEIISESFAKLEAGNRKKCWEPEEEQK